MIRRAFTVLITGLLAACGPEQLTGTATRGVPAIPGRAFFESGIAVTGDEGSSTTLVASSQLPLDGGPLQVVWEYADGSAPDTTFSADGQLATSHTWEDNHDPYYAVLALVSAPDGSTEEVRFDVTINNVDPTGTLVAPTRVNAGASFALSVINPFDPSPVDVAYGLTFAFDCGDGNGLQDASDSPSVQCAGGDPGFRDVRALVFDKDGGLSAMTTTIEIADACVAPSSASITASADPVQIGTPVSVIVAFADATDAGTTVELTWSDGSTAVAAPVGGSATFSRTFTSAGVHAATATVRNACGSVTTNMSSYVVVYDPSAGFVTGGGWVIAAPGSYTDDATLTGKATFGFVAKYQKGAHVPTGHTEFQFHANGLDFKSGTYQWLVIAGSRAQYKGVGTIKGRAGTFSFLLTAIDGGPGGSNDAFRMKILDSAGGVVFDNRQGSSDSSNDATQLAGGSISIKK